MSKLIMNEFQPSMTEWLAEIGDVEASQAFRVEDHQRDSRLETLFQAIGLAYERPERFPAQELKELSPRFQSLLKERGHLSCAIRLVPLSPDLPKLRQRGLPLRECYEHWFLKQDVDLSKYEAHVYPHSDTLLWSTIFLVTDKGISGEMVRGMHAQLTHGDTDEEVIRFSYDWQKWQWSREDEEAKKYMEHMVERVHVAEGEKQGRLTELLQASFAHDHLKGYFEATVWPDGAVYFIDYNRILPSIIGERLFSAPKETDGTLLTGVTAYPGVAQGQVILVTPETLTTLHFPEDGILVCDNTDVRFLPFMKKAQAIITNRGGMLSHASIVARELKKPCLIATKKATEILKTGEMIEVDADQGNVKRL